MAVALEQEHAEVMTNYDLIKGRKQLFTAAGLGWFQQRKWWSYDTEAGLVVTPAGLPAGPATLTFRRTSWGRVHTALEGGREVGRFDRRGVFVEKGPLQWQNVDYEFTAVSTWKATFALNRHGEQLATFRMKSWREHIELEVVDHQPPPPGLLLFCAWATMAAVRDRNAAAAA